VDHRSRTLLTPGPKAVAKNDHRPGRIFPNCSGRCRRFDKALQALVMEAVGDEMLAFSPVPREPLGLIANTNLRDRFHIAPAG